VTPNPSKVGASTPVTATHFEEQEQNAQPGEERQLGAFGRAIKAWEDGPTRHAQANAGHQLA
jgi:hypothetical protein